MKKKSKKVSAFWVDEICTAVARKYLIKANLVQSGYEN
jgi:hypothetical protein